ncbi:SH3 domain-containing kinase-binding protein 1 [Gracilinanus agilis]|uniref:SH3 domain-containing kinase-binding protein 1 n=1 Tax=Gracilinanus agilis TaxID=191870 RepID=UPI001CFD78A2|nr:SH3 domain-containing kinase-binding protein 1 [Gracilinanus agilis]
MVEAIVEFDYKAQHDDELTISVGDIITNIKKEDGGWWEGQVKGRRGLFPDNFVREIKKEMKKETLSSKPPEKPMQEVSNGSSLLSSDTVIRTNKKERNRRRRCQVAFSYLPQNDDELELKVGDIIEVVGEDCIDVGWWEGELNGRRGVFPDNFVKLLPPDFEKEGNRPKKPPPPSAPVIKQGAGTTERKHEIKKIPPERPETLPNRTEEKERPEREQKLDLQKPSVPAIPPKKPRPPKTNSLSRPGALPPRRPERPVVPVTHTRSDSPKIDLVVSTVSGTSEKDLSDRSNDIDLEGFDSVVSSTEKLSHPTTSRPKATGRRPPSQSLTSSSLSSPDFFDSPSPEEDKEEHPSLAHRGIDVTKKTAKTVTISQVSDNKASLPPKPGGMAAVGSSTQTPLSSSSSSSLHSSSLGTTSHRSNSPSLFSVEGKPKTEQLSYGQSAVEELRTQVKELRTIIETMKDQQKREIKQLLSELDEEKKIRLRLQMEVNDIKKVLQSK